jgi:hypothetical protein
MWFRDESATLRIEGGCGEQSEQVLEGGAESQ